MTSTARDVMETHVVSVGAEDPLSTVQRLFVEESITGAPVVDDQDRVVGVISSSDLMRAAADEHDTDRGDLAYFREGIDISGTALLRTPEDYLDRLAERTVGEYMSEEVVSVAPDESIAQVARLMRSQRVHRLIVLDEGRPVGIISAFDLIGLLEKG